MNIRFNIEKSQRKALAQKIGELTGSEVKYLGVPSCGYQIGAYTLDKEAVLHGDELPDDIRSELQKAGYTAEDEPVALTAASCRRIIRILSFPTHTAICCLFLMLQIPLSHETSPTSTVTARAQNASAPHIVTALSRPTSTAMKCMWMRTIFLRQSRSREKRYRFRRRSIWNCCALAVQNGWYCRKQHRSRISQHTTHSMYTTAIIPSVTM